MNTYNKLLLDEIQANASVLAKYLDSANLTIGNRLNISSNLETAIDNLDCAYDIIKESINITYGLENLFKSIIIINADAP